MDLRDVDPTALVIVRKTNSLNFNEKLNQMREYARLNGVPIIKDEGLVFLKNIISLKRPKNILEIGSAIGYSASMMVKDIDSIIYTIEKDINMYNIASSNINELGLNDKIKIYHADALVAFDLVRDIKFDLIFIDAAKAQYNKFFDIYTPLLNQNGIVVCDNMLFHGVVENSDYSNLTKGLRGLVRKINSFTDVLMNNDKFETTLYDIGDGMSISVLK